MDWQESRRHGLERIRTWAVLVLAAGIHVGALAATNPAPVLQPEAFAHYVEHFNAMDDENQTNWVSNAQSWEWMRTNIPFFECPDREVEETYYFRWWSWRKHIRRTPTGFVLTEFLTKTNPISSALGHHIMEGRWLRDRRYMDEDVLYWLLSKDGAPTPDLYKYSSWLEYALYQRYLADGNAAFVTSLLEDMTRDYAHWEQEKGLTNGLFWQYDVRDAMEESISGSRTNKNARPSVSSYMYGNARAIASIAWLAGNKTLAREYDRKAARIQGAVETLLWNPKDRFFEVLLDNGRLADVREGIGFIPWYFNLPKSRYGDAWGQLTNRDGFCAPYGITTAERRHPKFRSHGYGHCEWDGAVWPFATSQTLTALGNALREDHCDLDSGDYFDAFLAYVHSQRQNGKPYIGEYLDETTGQWFNGKEGRSRYYNHSTFADLLITGVVGLQPRADNRIEVHPLLPRGRWDWFCLDGVPYHGHVLTILWDKDGTRYGKGRGLRVYCDNRLIVHASRLRQVKGSF